MPQTCPLCHSNRISLFHQNKKRTFYRCPECSLIFVPSSHHLSPVQEKMRYNLHQNSLSDKIYVQMLERLARPLSERLPQGAKGLDFGSGPEPVFAQLMQKKGYNMSCYDPYYAKDPSMFTRQWDFIGSTEVAEHLCKPYMELERLYNALRPGGWLGLMTQLYHPGRDFGRWHYIHDMTHVSFFSEESFRWLSENLGAQISFPAEDIVLMRRHG